MTNGRDPCRPVHVDSDITLIRDERFAGMQTYPHPNRTVQPELSVARSRERIRRARKREEEGVSVHIHLDAAVTGECLPQRLPMLAQHIGVLLAQLAQQPSRPLDVREQEGDRAGGKAAHGLMMRPSPEDVQPRRRLLGQLALLIGTQLTPRKPSVRLRREESASTRRRLHRGGAPFSSTV